VTPAPADTEEWQRVKKILGDALDLDPASRGTFIAAACAGDERLRQKVETLAAAADGDWDLVDAAPAARLAAFFDEAPRSRVGERIGAYEILSELGHGGMGMVYLAGRADDEFQKKVAIKLMRPGTASEDALRRFRSERQIAASLDHPNIARLLDGGTTGAGEPYFALEYVEGEPLIEWCNHRRLAIDDRLRLFREICAAVQHAHQGLVVHRDIKPGNIFVTSTGTPKLLDFGIAKLLQPEGAAAAPAETGTLMRLMTPEYASPEQVRGRRVTTASDVYSLGVVLYELLSGRQPYRVTTGDPEEMIRVVCERDPERPSTAVARPDATGSAADAGLARRLRGDLDAIVLKAMRKEPELRYASADQLSEDIGRHLAGVPVLARRGTAGYRAGKFARRHRLGFAAAALVLAALAGGIVMTVREARRARAAEARAQRRFNDVRQLANSFLNEFHDSIKQLPGSTPARRLLVQKGLAYLDSLSREASEDASLLRDLADGYQRLGDLQGSPGEGSAMLGDMAGAQASLRKCAALREKLVASRDALPQDRLDLARAYSRLANTFTLDGNASGAVEFSRKALAVFSAEQAANPADQKVLHSIASAELTLGSSHQIANSPDDALAAFRRGLAMNQRLCASDPTDVPACRGVFVGYYKIGNLEIERDRPVEAAAAYRDAVRIAEGFHRGEPGNGMYQRDLAFAAGGLGAALLDQGDATGAEEQFRTESQLMRSLADADPGNTNPRIWLGEAVRNGGNALIARGDMTAGRARIGESAAMLESVVATDPANFSARMELAQTYRDMGKSYSAQAGEAPHEARVWFEKARSQFLELRREGKLAPSGQTLLSRVDELIAALDKRSGGK
jgi:eukaryotic-like serine/threonine-protein kinase